MENMIEEGREVVVLWGGRVAGILLALFVAWIVAGWLSRATRRTLERRNFDATLTRFFSKLVRYAILTFAIVGCLGVFGIQTASFAAVIAAAGLAVGLAFQGTLSNFAAGVMLLVFRPFRVGDAVVIDGEIGVVEEIELFTTELKSADNKRLILPNSGVFSNKIVNITHYPMRRVDIDVGVDYAADIATTRRVLAEMIPQIPRVLSEPAPEVFLNRFGDSSVQWQIRVWCRTEEYWDVWQATTEATKRALDVARIGIPFPQTDVHLDERVVTALAAARA